MRYVVAILLAVVAIVAAGIWALGEYGGGLSGGATEAQAPLVREPSAPAPSQQTAELKATPAPAEPAPATTPEAAAAAEPVPAPPPPPPGAQPTPMLAPSLDDRNALSTTPPPAPTEPPVTTASVPPGPTTYATTASTTSSVADKFKSRRVTYNRPPKKLALNKAIDVSLVINATGNPDAGAEALQGFPGTVVDRDVDLSDVVSAALTGVGFDITQQTIERQKLSGKTLNRWQWRVTPTELGKHELTLEIFGYEPGAIEGEPLEAYKDVIEVEVKQFAQVITWARGVQPVFAVLAALAGALSALFAFLRFREEKKRGASPPSA